MKRILTRLFSIVLSAAVCLSVSGCGTSCQNGRKVDYIQIKYNGDECRAEAERLFGMPFDIVESSDPADQLKPSSYTLRSKQMPFDITVFSEHELSVDPYARETTLYAHAYCDYYEQMMNFKQKEADAAAKKYGLEIKREGQTAVVYVTGYDMLEKICDYLNETNELYDFTVVESEMTNILRDIRNRPELRLYLDRKAFDINENQTAKIITLYYTINHDTYNYTMKALLPTVQESYIDCLDALGLTDSAVTAEIRDERCKPALTSLCINGEPVIMEDNGGSGIVFDYNWLMNDYYGDIMIAKPSDDYSAPQDIYGDDRVFKQLVETLGGSYSSQSKDFSPVLPACSAQWNLGGNSYSATVYYQQEIPTMSSYSVNGTGLSIDHYYSKEMWGLENGYGPEDYYIRLTPEALGTLLGVSVEADYEKGILNLITPKGYYEANQAYEQAEAQKIPITERFTVDGVSSANGLVKNHSHYIIYNADGSVLEEFTTKEDIYADLEQMSESVVMLRIHGVGSVDNMTFFYTDSGEISDVYNYADIISYPYMIYAPEYTGKIVVVNVETGQEYTVTDKAAEKMQQNYESYTVSSDMKRITITYFVPDRKKNIFTTVTETFPLELP